MNIEDQASFAALAPFVRAAYWPGDGSVLASVRSVNTRLTASQGPDLVTPEALLRRALAGLAQSDVACDGCRALQHGIAAIATGTWTSVDDADARWLGQDAGTSLAVAADTVQAMREHALVADGHEIARRAAPERHDAMARLSLLRADVLAGRWPAYSALPPEVELAALYAVEPHWVRAVLAGLRAEHVLLEAPGGRLRVVDRSRDTGLVALLATAAVLPTAHAAAQIVRIGRRTLAAGDATVVLDRAGLTDGVCFYGDRGPSRVVLFRNDLPLDLDHDDVYDVVLSLLIALAIRG